MHYLVMGTTQGKKSRNWGKVGDVVTGRTKDGRRWTAYVGPSGKLIGKVFL